MTNNMVQAKLICFQWPLTWSNYKDPAMRRAAWALNAGYAEVEFNADEEAVDSVGIDLTYQWDAEHEGIWDYQLETI